MNEAGLIREQRRLLRTYCEAISARNLMEVDAEEQRKAAREIADVALTQLRYSADLQTATARKALEDARVTLLGANQSELLEEVHVAPTAALRNTNPAHCLTQAVAAAASAQGSIVDAVGVLTRWHRQHTVQRRWQMLLGAVAVIGVIVILVVMTTTASQVQRRVAEQRATATRWAAEATH
jgi:hypothetical protein